ncbi:hypothetical protein [Pseudomonas oryzihabitans]|uniref:hypothetical protein n=1 Tax=Pseudomonas oryzihabitans TaxID=47885 RepID=UPI00286067C6|nr:hypothetical protein [Pseudomonas psychrotolerans]MDR6679508.1 hypothetical protein [Pseudomonas psychrotolerans]
MSQISAVRSSGVNDDFTTVIGAPSDFPPPKDFPIVISKEGVVISKYGDDVYDFSIYAGRPLKVSFKNSATNKYLLNKHHYELLKMCLVYFLFSHPKRLSIKTVVSKVESLKIVVVFCLSRGINFDQISRYPKVWDELASLLIELGERGTKIISVLLDIYYARKVIGFHGPDINSLSSVSVIAKKEGLVSQTPYIPSRILFYQIGRLEYFLDEFLKRETSLVDLFNTILNAYIKNTGSIENACRSGPLKNLSPFREAGPKGVVNLGSFSKISDDFGVLDCIRELLCLPGEDQFSPQAGAKPLGRYFNAMSFIAQIFLINFSGMRISEAASLRQDCFQVDSVEGGGNFYFLKAVTKKTIDDPNALWVTASIAKKAVDVLRVISTLRTKVMEMDSRIPLKPEDISNPYLVLYGVEPWLPSKAKSAERDSDIRSWLPYEFWKKICPGLFSIQEITITESDLREALQANPSLKSETYAVGLEWKFGYHQLRRTLMVNAVRSDLVSIYSRQYQMKHMYQSMCTWYGRGGVDLAFSHDIQFSFVEEVYYQIAVNAKELLSDNYFSPVSSKQKENLISILEEKHLAKLLKEAKLGKLSVKQTLLGVCTSKGFCNLGGADNIVDCGSCHEALVDKRKLPLIQKFLGNVDYMLGEVLEGTPAHQSLIKQRTVAIKIIEAINVKK